MFVIEVIPLIRGTHISTLSYYSATSYPIGTFLEVPVRNRLTWAVVTEIHSVSDAKTNLRNAAFSLKKLPPQAKPFSVPENVRKTAEILTKTYPATMGAILYQLLPPEVRAGKYQYPAISTLVHNEESAPRVLTAPTTERFVTYRSHIRSVLARRGSILFVVPTSTDIETAQSHLEHGIEDRIVTFSPTHNEREMKAAYAAFEDTNLAKVIITTTSHAYLDRVDLLSIIIENEASDFYVSRTRPYLDHRTTLITHAKATGRSVLLGDILPRTETEYLRREEFYSTEGEPIKRIAFTAPLTIIEQTDKPTAALPFALFSPQLHDRITTTLSGRGRVFIYGARRGLAPVVACIDCGHIARCPDSGTPFSLIRTKTASGEEERWFVSRTSGRRTRAADTCVNCGSWRLRERGIGIQSVYDECVEHFPGQEVLLFDHLTASTPKKARAIIDQFYSTQSTLLVGTQMALPYLTTRGTTISAVTSLDAARATPTWRADEVHLRLLLNLREMSKKEVIVQTRATPDALLAVAENGTIESFYSEELPLREALHYPPFFTFILLSWQGGPVAIEKTEKEILSRTTAYPSTVYSDPLSTSVKILRHALFRLPAKAPEKTELIALLRSFPPYIKIEIDPPRIV